MSPARLLEHFDRLINTPDAVPRLRRFILDLAVRGKLVEQDPKDEPAGELLERIEKQRRRLVKDGKIKDPKDLPAVEQAERPYDIPIGWRWTRLGASVNRHSGGGTPSKNNSAYWDGDIHWASVKDIGKTKYVDDTIDRITEAGLANSSSNLIPPGNLIVVTRMGLGKISINRIPVAINQDLRALSLSKLADIDFYYIFFKTASYEGSGLTVKGIKVEELLNFPFPLPPLAEQHRIVAKVAELMALCDELEAAQTKREKRRDRLVAATLHGLGNADATPTSGAPSTFEESARFYFNHLPRLTTRPEHIHQLRQTILNLAVRGKLVPQDPKDEPAAELVKRVNAEMSQRGGVRGKSFSPSGERTDGSYALPAGWAWARFPDLGKFGRGKSRHRPRNDSSLFNGGTHLLVQTGDVARSGGKVRTFTGKYNDTGLAQSEKWPIGTLCITIAANIADSGILSFAACFPDSVVGFIPSPLLHDAQYFEYFLRTAKAALLEFAPATAQKNINLGILNEVRIPLPPLAEQRRIVAKLDELMALCADLEGGMSRTMGLLGESLDACLTQTLE